MLSDRRFSIDQKALTGLLHKVLKSEGSAGKSLNVVYCSDNLITSLNRQFKHKETSTDVLAFEIEGDKNDGFIGEVYVNLQQAKRQAREYGVSYKQEVKRLTVHGLLHLLGYRDAEKNDREIMWSRQEGYL